jgi:hypothetical protein
VSTLGLKGIVWPLISGANPPKKVNVSEMRPASIRLSVRIACRGVCEVRERRVSYGEQNVSSESDPAQVRYLAGLEGSELSQLFDVRTQQLAALGHQRSARSVADTIIETHRRKLILGRVGEGCMPYLTDWSRHSFWARDARVTAALMSASSPDWCTTAAIPAIVNVMAHDRAGGHGHGGSTRTESGVSDLLAGGRVDHVEHGPALCRPQTADVVLACARDIHHILHNHK